MLLSGVNVTRAYPEITMRKFWREGEKIWWASPANGVVGYFYLADKKRK